jgi:hypothetical protein
MTSVDFLKRLRLNTAKLLGLDPENLSFVERCRLDRAVALRLKIDELQTKQLQNDSIDIDELTTALEALEKLVTPRTTNVHSDARAQLEALIARHIEAREYEEATEVERLREQNALLVEENARLRAMKSGGGDAHSNSDAHSPNSPIAAARFLTDIEKMDAANCKPPPPHYLKQADEPWRKYVNQDGIITPNFGGRI